jgi:hypothetical protein
MTLQEIPSLQNRLDLFACEAAVSPAYDVIKFDSYEKYMLLEVWRQGHSTPYLASTFDFRECIESTTFDTAMSLAEVMYSLFRP